MRNMAIVSSASERDSVLFNEKIVMAVAAMCRLTSAKRSTEPPKSVTAPERFLYLAGPPHPQTTATHSSSPPHEPLRQILHISEKPIAAASIYASAWTPPLRRGPWSTISVALSQVSAPHRRARVVERARQLSVVLASSGRCFDGVPKATIRELSLRRRETAHLSLSERVAGRRAGLRVLWVVVDICVLLLARGNRGAAVGRLVCYFLRCDESHRRLGLGSGSGMVKGAVAKGEI